MTEIVKKEAPKILKAIKASNSILLHCHPSPDPDSVGSALAMKFALESLGKKATVIRGDSEIPQAFMHFPGAESIVPMNFFEVDLEEFDLFIVQDTGGLGRVSRIGEVKIPTKLKTIAIDHHDSTKAFGSEANLIDSSYPATATMLYDLFKIWKIYITPEIAANLFIGIYTDTGGFKYEKTTSETFVVASELTKAYPTFSKLILTMENSNTPERIAFQGLAFSSIKVFLNGKLAISAVSYGQLTEKHIPRPEASTSSVSSILRSVISWDVTAAIVEIEPNVIKLSLRSKDPERFDVSKLAAAIEPNGGGGHKAAAGAVLTMPLSEAIEKIVNTAKEIYNL